MDKEIWGEYRFDRAYDLIWNYIASRAAHQQRVENLVQTAGHLGKTHVEEARRSARAKIHCIFYRDFNTWALQIVRKEDETKLLRAIQTNQQTQQFKRRVEDKKRLEMMLQWIDQQNAKIDVAEKALGTELLDRIIGEMNRSNKSRTLDNERKQQLFETMSKQQRVSFANSRNLIDVTPWMEGSIILSLLQEKDGGRPVVMAEIHHCRIKYEFVPKPNKKRKELTKKEQAKYDKGFEDLSFTDLKKLLKNEQQHL